MNERGVRVLCTLFAVVAIAGGVAGCEDFDGRPDAGEICSEPGATTIDEHGRTLVCG